MSHFPGCVSQNFFGSKWRCLDMQSGICIADWFHEEARAARQEIQQAAWWTEHVHGGVLQIQASYEEGWCHCCNCQSLICCTASFMQTYYLIMLSFLCQVVVAQLQRLSNSLMFVQFVVALE